MPRRECPGLHSLETPERAFSISYSASGNTPEQAFFDTTNISVTLRPGAPSRSWPRQLPSETISRAPDRQPTPLPLPRASRHHPASQSGRSRGLPGPVRYLGWPSRHPALAPESPEGASTVR
jgi:hypothetical protein